MKKVLVIILSVAMVAVLFAGCAGTGNTTSTEEATVSETTTAVEASETAAETTVVSGDSVSMPPDEIYAEYDEMTASGAYHKDGGKIYFNNAYYTAPYCGPLNQSIIDTAAAYGYEVVIDDGNGDGGNQLNQIETAIADGSYDAILYFPADGASSINIVKLLVDSGIPFLNDNSEVDSSVIDQVHYVGIDAYAQGVTAAEMAMEVLPNGGNVVMIQGAGGSGPEIGRTNGFLDTIPDNIVVLDQQVAGWDPETALTVMEDFISKYGDEIDVVYTQDDGMYEGAIKAAQDAGVAKDYTFISVSGNEAGIQGISDGLLYCTVAHSPVTEGVLTIDTLMKLLAGEAVPNKTIFESVPVTKDNVDDPKFANPGW
jgi:ribose transport system substrate-binding protein